MSVPPVPTCPRCRVPVNAQAHVCHQCGLALGQHTRLSPPIPYYPPPQQDRWLKLKASLLNGFGGTFAVGGTLMTLFSIVMGTVGVGDVRPTWGLMLGAIIMFGMPPLIAGLAMMNGARNIRKQLEGVGLVQPAAQPGVTTKVEDEITRIEREVDALIKKLPRSHRDQGTRLEGEVEDLVSQLRAMEKRLDELNRMAAGMPGAELDARRASIESRLATEQDSFIKNALEQQLQGIEGQLEARQSVETSCARLNAAYDAALHTLRYLHAELQATTALASNSQGEALNYGASDLKSISDEIARTRAASEEVIRMTQG